MLYESEEDTKKLLRECDAGIKMGIASLDDMVSKAADPELEQVLKDSKQEHIKLRVKAEKQLNKIGDKGKAPNPMAKSMSYVKTQLTMQTGTDKDAAGLVTKGCEKGIQSLHQYLDKYSCADSQSRGLTTEIIAAEQKLISELGRFNG